MCVFNICSFKSLEKTDHKAFFVAPHGVILLESSQTHSHSRLIVWNRTWPRRLATGGARAPRCAPVLTCSHPKSPPKEAHPIHPYPSHHLTPSSHGCLDCSQQFPAPLPALRAVQSLQQQWQRKPQRPRRAGRRATESAWPGGAVGQAGAPGGAGFNTMDMGIIGIGMSTRMTKCLSRNLCQRFNNCKRINVAVRFEP